MTHNWVYTLQETIISHLGEKENHLQICQKSGEYVHSLEGRFSVSYMGFSKNRGTPKWMVYDGKPY